MNGIGYVQSVRNQDKKAGGYFQVAMVLMEGMTEAYNMAYFGNSDIHATVNHRIEVEWEEQNRGGYLNRSINNFKVLPASLQATPASGAVAPGSQISASVTITDPKQENINRQSAYHQAVALISTSLANGYNVVVGDSKKAKSAAKDPEVLLEWVKYTARRIKEDVQQGNWETSAEITEPEKDHSSLNDDIPF